MKGNWDDHDPEQLSRVKQHGQADFRNLPNLLRKNQGADPCICRIKNINDVMSKSKNNEAADLLDIGAAGAAPTKKNGSGSKSSSKNGWQNPGNPLLLRDFILPQLDNGFYGEDLKWLDRSSGKFFIRWTHQEYPVRDNQDESKDNKKKRGLCGCLTDRPDCEPQEQPLKSRAKMSDDLDQDMDNLQEIDNKSHACSSGTQNSRSAPPAAPSSDISPAVRCLTGACYEPSALPGSSSEEKKHDGALLSSVTWSPAEMEAACTLLSLWNACHK
ncbi:hypothetical protein MTO96_003869 [Rhipicephalus appendiculatus]